MFEVVGLMEGSGFITCCSLIASRFAG